MSVVAHPAPAPATLHDAADVSPVASFPPVKPASRAERWPFLDLLRALSAHMIVWHHLAFYGPLSDVVAVEYPRLIDFLFEHGRNAVQVFFVIGGFVAVYFLALPAYRVLLVWCYDRTASLLLVMFMHAVLSASTIILQPLSARGHVTWNLLLGAALWAVVAAVAAAGRGERSREPTPPAIAHG